MQCAMKEHRKVEELENTVATPAAMVKEQASKIQRVNAELQLQRPATRVVKSRDD
jgi:hypothetical protein